MHIMDLSSGSFGIQGPSPLHDPVVASPDQTPFTVSVVMARSPFQRVNAGIVRVEQLGDYANQSTIPATGPRAIRLFAGFH